jgi:hypothetical protein
LEGENYTKAVESVRKVLEANYQGTDIVLLTIARIEMGWLAKRTAMSTSSETFFQAAERDLSTLGDQQDKRKLILDSLPNRVRLEWDEWERELLKKSQESRDS